MSPIMVARRVRAVLDRASRPPPKHKHSSTKPIFCSTRTEKNKTTIRIARLIMEPREAVWTKA